MGENKMEIFHELVKREPNLLSLPIEKLTPLSYVGHEAVRYAKGINKKLDKLPLTLEQKKRWLADAQEMGEIVIDIEARIGELLPPPEETYKESTRIIPDNTGKITSKKVLPDGIDNHKAYIARQIKNHPEIVEEVKREAKENDDIATKTAILNRIRYEREKERKENKPPTPAIVLKGQELIMQNIMKKYLYDLREKMPKELTEKGYVILKALAMTINQKHKELFNGKEEKNIIGRSEGNA